MGNRAPGSTEKERRRGWKKVFAFLDGSGKRRGWVLGEDGLCTLLGEEKSFYISLPGGWKELFLVLEKLGGWAMKKWNNSKHGDSSFFGTKISLIHFSAAEVNLEAVKVSEAFESGK